MEQIKSVAECGKSRLQESNILAVSERQEKAHDSSVLSKRSQNFDLVEL